MLTRVLSMFALLSFSACGESGRPSQQQALSDSSVLLADSSGWARLQDFGRTFGQSRAELRRLLGQPCDESASGEPNRHGYATDTVFRLECAGQLFVLRRPGAESYELLESTRLTRAGTVLPASIRIGHSTVGDIRGRLGIASSTASLGDTLRLSYEPNTVGADESLCFFFVSDTLRAVEWRFYVD